MGVLSSKSVLNAARLSGLVVDASEETRFVTRFFLSSLKVATEEASSGKDALRKVVERPFDFMVLEESALNDMTCEEFFHSLASLQLEKAPPIILVSAVADSTRQVFPVAAVLQKPFTVGSLEDAIWSLFPA